MVPVLYMSLAGVFQMKSCTCLVVEQRPLPFFKTSAALPDHEIDESVVPAFCHLLRLYLNKPYNSLMCTIPSWKTLLETILALLPSHTLPMKSLRLLQGGDF
ncbi:hypothetical protein EDC04DRAFT_611223 [Pisolithus marmoratus]|nr:hypothetical protein EDC04DRAFT_611223 [Pisolithus marmoratus]